jgi:hypothetical protein
LIPDVTGQQRARWRQFDGTQLGERRADGLRERACDSNLVSGGHLSPVTEVDPSVQLCAAAHHKTSPDPGEFRARQTAVGAANARPTGIRG